MPTTVLNGVGAKFAETLKKLGIASIQDLLFHLPSRYVDRTRIRSIGSLRVHDVALLEVQVLSAQIGFGKRRSLQVKVEDSTGSLSLRFFHFNAAQKNAFEKGRKLRVFGELRPGSGGIEIYHPEYDFLDNSKKFESEEERLTPIYGLTEGVSQPRLRSLAMQAVELLKSHSPQELLPNEVNNHFQVNSLADALAYVHFPPADCDQHQLLAGEHPFQQRLAFEELLAHYLVKQNIRAEAQATPAPALSSKPEHIQRLLDQLPFEPTRAQQRVFTEVEKDLSQSHPMLRMIQGDVGSGKTLVAAMATMSAVSNGYQVALVAPTEILAEQHLRNFKLWFDKLDIRVDWLVGRLTPKQKQKVYEALAEHKIDIVVGTHALFQDKVMFDRLGLVIIDEQHRFGVHQRLSLRDKTRLERAPHQLVMTATPIPRTLAMTSYAELEFSIIDELPPGRKPVQTVVISQSRKDEITARIASACAEGRQVYWVCPLIEESETLSAANAEQTFETLKAALPEVAIELIHGRLKPVEKESRMAGFKEAKTQVLVATTVIEVGVDVPNASIMIIENPERLGLAQLHQLRGRVGRGTAESHCILLYGEKLSQQGKERLQVLRETNDGFVISEKDLEMRGPGEFLGTRQAGEMLYRIADHHRDAPLFELVHKSGKSLMAEDPKACEQLIDRWFGQRKNYALA